MPKVSKGQSDQGRPDLDLYCILAGSEEMLDLEVLLQVLGEELDFPAFPVDVLDGCRAEPEIICFSCPKSMEEW